MKHFARIALIIIAACLVWLCIPKSCEPSGKYEQLEKKSNQSLMRDSIKTSHYLILKKSNDSIRNILQDSLNLVKAKNEKLSVSYYAIRSKLKALQLVHIDSSSQVVEVPAEVYNDAINSGNLGDELLQGKDIELSIKDSIISVRDIDVKALTELVEAKELSKADLLALIDELQKELKKCKNQNKALKIIAVITTLTNLLH